MEIRTHAAQNLAMKPFAKLLLAGTSFAPILITLAFVNWRADLPWWYAASKLGSAMLLVWLCHLLLKEVERRGEVMSITLSSAKPADKEILAFVLSYLIPLANTANVMKIDPAVIWFVLGLLLFLVYVSNAYQFNPLLVLFFGYHFYEVTDESKIGYILITRRNIHNVSAIAEVVEITDYVIMEYKHGR
jgi:hypothetical protein